MNKWTKVAMTYCFQKTLPTCPFCKKATIEAQEHKDATRTSVTFSCPNCKRFEHMDGIAPQ